MSFSNGKAARYRRDRQFDRYAGAALAVPEILSAPFSPHSYATGFFTVIFFILLAPSLLRGEIAIEARVGFHGVFQLGRPFPLDIELSNSGRPVQGVLEVQVWKGGATKGGTPYPLHYRRELFLSAHSRRAVQLTVDPDFISRPLSISFSSQEGRASRELDLRRYFSPAPLMVLLTEANSLSVFFGSSSNNRLITLAVNELPGDPRALLGVSHLILYDQSLRDLSRNQLLALDTWLSAGGRMVILGSLNYALYQEPAISRFLPVRVTGTRRISFTPHSSAGEDAKPIAGVWAQSSTVLDGEVRLEEAGLPLLVESSRGKGRITYLALDVGRPPLAQWNGLPLLLRTMVTPAAGDESALRTRWDDAIFAQILLSPSFISTYVPTGALLLAMLGYLAGIGVLVYLWQKRWLSPRRLGICMAAWVAASSLGGYMFFSRGGNIPNGVLLSSTVLDILGGGYVEAHSNVAMFSTQIRQYNLKMGRGWIDMMPVGSSARETAESAVVLQDGGGSSRYRLPLREWDYKLFRMRFVERFGLRVESEAQPDILLMKVDNRSAKDLVDCWLVVPGRRHQVGDIPRGASWRKGFLLANSTARDPGGSYRTDTLDLREVSFNDKTRNILFHSSFFPRDGEASVASANTAVFFGWVKDPERRVSVEDQSIRAHDYTLFRAIIPLPHVEDE